VINSRDKGAAFEREIAAALHKLTGITFLRNLEQYRMAEQGDLIADDPAWPFMIECKRAAAENGRRQQWQRQAIAQAGKTGQLPCVIYRLNRKPARALVPLHILLHRNIFDDCEWVEMSLTGLCYVAAMLMDDAPHARPHYRADNAPPYDPDAPDSDGWSA
jgi:Holliday junction resolvase